MTLSTLERADGTAYPLTPPHSVRSLERRTALAETDEAPRLAPAGRHLRTRVPLRERRPLTPAAHTSKGQRTHITGSALALDKKGD